MTKKGLIPFMLIVGALSAEAADIHNYGEIWSTSNKAKERVPYQFELEVTNKETYAYENLLRVMDELNRKKNISSNYTKDYYGTIPKIADVDIVPIWFEGEKYANDDENVNSRFNRENTGKYYSKDHIDAMMNSQNKDDINQFSYNYKENNPRFYFGNGNVVQDIKIENATDFEKEIKNAKANNNERYVVSGQYTPFNSEAKGLYNPLNITEKEYKEHFLSNGQRVSNHNPELLKFLSKKMNDSGIATTIENGELVTTVAGKTRKVIWNAHPFSMPNMNRKDGVLIGKDPTSPERYQNTLLTQIFLYEDGSQKGETLYTNDGNIIVKDILSYNDKNGKIIYGGDNYKEYSKLNEIIEDYNKVKNDTPTMTEDEFKTTHGFGINQFKPFNYQNEIFNDFDKLNDGSMSEKDFKAKWDIAENDSTYKQTFADLKNGSTEFKELEMKTNANNSDYFTDKISALGISDWRIKYNYFRPDSYSTDTTRQDMRTKYAGNQAVLDIFNEYDAMYARQLQLEKTLSEGMKDYIRFSPTQDIAIDKIGKYVDFGGKGKIEGTIDLGEGYNELRITEGYSGKYGTNIILGQNARIKNVDVIKVGGQVGAAAGKHGLSGLTSLSIEIDPNHKNEKGYLDKHAFQGTWTDDNKVIFKSAKSIIDVNDYSIELILSGINNDSKIDIGRALKYTYNGVDYDSKLISDSIIHQLKPVNEDHSIYDVKVKKSLKVLSNSDNDVLRSLINAGQLSAIKETITSTNKQTMFATGESDIVERNKDLALFKALRQKVTPKEILSKLSVKDLNAMTQENLENIVTEIQNYVLPSTGIKYFEKIESETDEVALKELLGSVNENIGPGELFRKLRGEIYYSQREQEVVNELEKLISELNQKNIYAKVNKISKEEMDVFAPMVIDHKFDFTSKKSQATGGATSGRFAKDEFKGTIYTGYGIYETPVKENLSLGFVVGGGSSDFHEIVNDDIRTVTTNSKIKGTRAYLGTFGRYQVRPNLTWVNGVGVQYGKYDVDRNWRDTNNVNYMYKGDVNTYTGNIYSNLAYIYKVNDTLNASIKGGLSYTLVNQGKVKEEDKAASIEVDSQNFNYLDGQVGVGLTKTIYGNEMSSSLGGTLSAVYGIAGYDNDDLNGRFKGSTSDFGIKGESHSKESVKLKLDYNVIYNAGFNYGLEGTYTTNSDEDNISVGVKAGYSF